MNEMRRLMDVVKQLDEVALRRDDEEMLDLDAEDFDDEHHADKNPLGTGDAPYYVAWHAQSHEWYGDGGPEGGQGRYKPKGDGGRIVAINVPTYSQAVKIADQLDKDYQDGNFEDKSVYGKWGEDYYLLDYHGSSIRSMQKMDDYEKEELRYTHPTPVDYSE